ncbi:hypothetical protein Tco_0952468 [Tanacetum coccineum]|uniref:Uncharacterized protein n=1 Tax=Tanacetum coccineum TaxID=301880 RepID=A0ABQ5DZZ3_9ASTR
MVNKSDLDRLSMDDLYNNLKVYESEIKGQSSSNSQNVAFVSSETLASIMKQLNNYFMKFLLPRSKGQSSSSTYADDMAGGDAYHEGEKILKENRKESEFQWQRNCWI